MMAERRVLFWMCVLVAINQLGFGAMVPSLPLYAQSFGVPASAIGMAVAAYGLARFVLAVPTGQLSDRLGRRPTLAIGGLVSAIGNLCCAWASAYPEFVVARFVAGAGAGLILTTGQVVLADISSPAQRGRSIAIYQGTFLFAVGIGPFPAGCSPSISGWRPPSSPMALPVCSRPSSPGLPSARPATCGAPQPRPRPRRARRLPASFACWPARSASSWLA
jgi:DHA1 family multidrug resistance protein-like MFS transporter